MRSRKSREETPAALIWVDDPRASDAARGAALVAVAPPLRIGELLIRRGVITVTQLDHALAEQTLSGRRLGSELTRLAMVTERQLVEALAERFGVPVAALRVRRPGRMRWFGSRWRRLDGSRR
jgi:hypothetical protein